MLGDVAACRREACVLCAVQSETAVHVCSHVNLKRLTKLMNSAYVFVWTAWTVQCNYRLSSEVNIRKQYDAQFLIDI